MDAVAASDPVGTATDATEADRVAVSSVPRILHVVSSVDHGGVEIWLLHLLRQIDRQLYPMDVLVLNSQHGALEEELRLLGCQVFYCPGSRNPWTLQRSFAEIIRRHGPYDVVHSHVHYFGGMVLRLAARSGIPGRIAHSRNDMRSVEHGPWRLMYAWLMKRWINTYATQCIAISVPAGEDLFGTQWRADERCSIVHSGRDLSGFVRRSDDRGLRCALGIPADALVLGHVGRFHARKNHDLIVDVAAEVLRRDPSAWLILVGDGPLEEQTRARADASGIGKRTVFAGARSDVPRLLMDVIDVFVFPSHHEGLGVAVVEAQAAGLPCVIADHLPLELDLVPALIHRLPTTQPPADWAAVVLQSVREPAVDRDHVLDVILESDFNIERSVAKIASVYATQRSRGRS